MTVPALSVIIPSWNEESSIAALIGDVAALRSTHEIVVVDGGSSDETVRIAGEAGARTLVMRRGRGQQLAAGAAAASGSVLCFLHADLRLPSASRRALDLVVDGGATRACAFRLRIDAQGVAYRMVEIGANVRSRLLGLPYGDQGLVIARTLYDRTGGFADVALMEDVMMARALRPLGGVQILPEHVLVSARRWERDGVLRRSLRNLGLLARFLGGTSPALLARVYRPEGERD